jgi:hypothetical protein
MQNQNPPKQPKNTSKVLTALEKLNVARERACQEIHVAITKNEKALQRIRFALGQAILDDPTRREAVAAILPAELKEMITDYLRCKATVEELRVQRRELA